MTPEEKAKELVSRYIPKTNSFSDAINEAHYVVDQIIDDYHTITTFTGRIPYWRKVKDAISLL
jgi:hypothetical protein